MKDYLSIGIQAAKLAGTIIQDRIGTISTDEITQKSVSDYVTDVDVTSEKTIIEHNKKFFPHTK